MKHCTFFNRFLFVFFFSCCIAIFSYFLFSPIYNSSSILIPYSLHPYDICETYPNAWYYLKFSFSILHLLSSILVGNWLYSLITCRLKLKAKIPIVSTSIPSQNSLFLLIGTLEDSSSIYLPEKSLYQNMLITGTIGSGKTSSAMYPFTKQLIGYKANSLKEKIGMLILDVKGNYSEKVLLFARQFSRTNDVHVIDLAGSITYNPLDKPALKPLVLANRLKTILTLFSPHTSDSYWLDKVEQTLAECIKFCRLYHDNYVTFVELHKLVTLPNYYLDKLQIIKEKFLSGFFSPKDCYDILSSMEFFQNEFFSLDSRTLSIIKSEITRITNCFISDYDVRHTFCPKKEDITFPGFASVVDKGSIVVLHMNISEYQILSKILATYLKLDFQQEVLSRLSYSSPLRTVAFLCDEYHEYCTASDADFFSQSREAKCINIVATQSYSSLFHTLSNPHTVKVILQSLVNKLWFRTDDITTIEDAQKQLGKEEKVKYSKTISENAKESSYSYFTNTFLSTTSNLSESFNQYTQLDFVYDTNFFTQALETFSCLAFLSDGSHMLAPTKLSLFPYFKSFQ